jgi:arylsulfatase
MIAFWPKGIASSKRGKFIRQFGYLPDFMATCVELAGATYPENLPPCVGNSLVPVLPGSNSPSHQEPVFWEHEGNAAVRWGNWKLVREYQKPWELYDLSTDRTEMKNLAKSNAPKQQEMVAMWKTWADKTGVAYPERFNMYQFLNQKKKNKQSPKSKKRLPGT